MQEKETTTKRWCIAGAIVLIVAGSLLHFVYPLAGKSKIAGLFAPVNESVWEHLKMGYWSLVLFTAFEYYPIKKFVSNYFTAKFTGILVLELTIVIAFYIYSPITGHSILWIDISSFVAGSVLCQFLSFRILRMKPFPGPVNAISLLSFVSLAFLLAVMTWYTPNKDIFMDHRNESYGIRQEK